MPCLFRIILASILKWDGTMLLYERCTCTFLARSWREKAGIDFLFQRSQGIHSTLSVPKAVLAFLSSSRRMGLRLVILMLGSKGTQRLYPPSTETILCSPSSSKSEAGEWDEERWFPQDRPTCHRPALNMKSGKQETVSDLAMTHSTRHRRGDMIDIISVTFLN